MRASTWVRVLALALLPALCFAACGGEDEPSGTNGGTVGNGDEGDGDAGGKEMPDLEAFTAIEVDGFTREDARETPMGLMARYKRTNPTASGAQLYVMLNVRSCAGGGCRPLSKDMDRDYLMSELPPVHKENPKLQFEVEEVDFHGLKGVASYGRSYMERASAGGTMRMSAHGVWAQVHDGVAHVSLYVYPMGGNRVTSEADQAKQMTKAEALKAAQDVYAAFKGLHGK